DLNYNNLSSQIRHANNNQHEISNSLDNDNQKFEPINYQLDADQQYFDESIDQDYSDQHSFYDLDNIESESIYEYEFSENINSDSLDDECEQTSIDIDNAPKTFDGMKSGINWDHECPFGFFKNFTNIAIFVWATKYIILTTVYQDLIQILLHPQFETKHLTTNLQCLKKQREQLPLMKIQSHMVLINTKNTLSTSKDSTRAYYFSLINTFNVFFLNLCEELWERDLWAESSLFGLPNIIILQGLFNCGDFVKYHSASKTIEVGRIRSFVIMNKKIVTWVQRLFSYKKILQYLCSKQHAPCSLQELYLVEESEPFIINPSSLIFPFGGNLRDFLIAFIEEIQRLEQGFIMNINGVNCWILGRLAMVTADLLQGNDVAGPLDSILYNYYQHTPQDAYHAVAEKIARLLDCTCLILTDQGENNINKYWKKFEAFIHDVRYFMTFNDTSFHIKAFCDIKSNFLDEAKAQLNFSCKTDIINYLIQTWGLSAKASKNVFLLVINRQYEYDQLQKTLDKELNALIKLFPDSFQNLPNLYINQHLVDHACQYATCINTAVGIKEMTLRYLAAGGTDNRISNIVPQLFKELIIEPQLHHLLSGWCIDNNDFSIHTSWEFAQDVRFCVGEAVETTLSDGGQPIFGIVKEIIGHKWNNDQDYIFINLKWLEYLNKFDDLLDCPIYHLQNANNNSWDRIHPISIVSRSPYIPFVHNCKSKCSLQQYDITNREYI
ncbi:16941_t:CDS:10, partial [Gigaspora margarita]